MWDMLSEEVQRATTKFKFKKLSTSRVMTTRFTSPWTSYISIYIIHAIQGTIICPNFLYLVHLNENYYHSPHPINAGRTLCIE